MRNCANKNGDDANNDEYICYIAGQNIVERGENIRPGANHNGNFATEIRLVIRSVAMVFLLHGVVW